ncbi:MAG: hypothetical protein AVO38_08330 [delta proteobacterium ML8_D]|nr:MAG: hypothetical protein AVO38_08330 [delta proteobacterium ML8_D]
MSEELNEYLEKGYIIEIVPIPREKGGGYMARLPELGRLAIIGDGETIQEAIDNLEIAKRELFAEYLQEGVRIPEPSTKEEGFSGKFVLRVPKYLHRDLVAYAKDNGMSLNQYCSYLLTANFERHVINEKIGNYIAELKTEVKKCWKNVSDLSFRISGRGNILYTETTEQNPAAYKYEQAA